MELKTRIHAEEGKQEIFITREFELPIELLFRAYTDADIVEEWMGTKVILLENKPLGGYRFETTDPKGNIHHFSGTIHSYEPNEKITRTFEMEATPFPPQLEFLHFERVSDDISKLTIHIIYRSIEDRDNMLKLPFAQGINWAHNRLQESMNALKIRS